MCYPLYSAFLHLGLFALWREEWDLPTPVLHLRSGLTSFRHPVEKLKKHCRLKYPFKVHPLTGTESISSHPESIWKIVFTLVWQTGEKKLRAFSHFLKFRFLELSFTCPICQEHLKYIQFPWISHKHTPHLLPVSLQISRIRGCQKD